MLTRLSSSSTLTAKSLSLSPSAVNTPTASSCSPTLSAGERVVDAGMEKGPDPVWAQGNHHHGTVAAQAWWHPQKSPLTSGRIHLHQDVLPILAELGGEGPQESRTEALMGSTVIRHEWSGL